MSFVPIAGKPRSNDIRKLGEYLLNGKKTLILTGAGISTESGIPDYRSPKGSYSTGHKPTTHQEFVKSESTRQRYWARAVVASKYWTKVQPNSGHHALVSLEKLGLVDHIITQNVDRLHLHAGSSNVLELHGNGEEVECLNCHTVSRRSDYHGKIKSINQEWFEKYITLTEENDIRADADIHLNVEDFSKIIIPSCESCHTGLIMPRIVFFGGSLTDQVRQKGFQLVEESNQMLVIGSSVTVGSAYRLCKAAYDSGKHIGIINIGETRIDEISTFKIDNTNIGPLMEATTDLLSI